MSFSIQPHLANEIVELIPLQNSDFEKIYAVASDPKIWENHPNKNRYEREVFKNFFEGALKSRGAYLIYDKASGEVAGSTRFYNYNSDDKSILIGYSFYGTKFWGKGINPNAKKVMLDYIFQHVDKVIFHVGAENYRSHKAMEKLGAKKLRELVVAYYGEPDRRNFEYEILKEEWFGRSN